MSEGAWKSVTSHVSQDAAATVRHIAQHMYMYIMYMIRVHGICTCIPVLTKYYH